MAYAHLQVNPGFNLCFPTCMQRYIDKDNDKNKYDKDKDRL